MKKLLYSFAIIPLLAVACGGQEDDEDALISEGAALTMSTEDPEVDETTADANAGEELDMNEAADDAVDASTVNEPHEGLLTCDFGALREQIRQRFDENGDGRLDRAERAELRDELDDHPRLRNLRRRLIGLDGRRPHYHVWKRIRWAFDVNNDHHLDDAERAELIAATEARCERRKQEFKDRYDANGDGSISRDELMAGLQDLRSRWQEAKADFLMRYDVNGDGTLSDEERLAVREDIITRRLEIRANVLEAFDANDNGNLDPDERDALKAEIRRRYVEGWRS